MGGSDSGDADCEAAGLECGEFEECGVSDGSPACLCIEGHTGADCTTCEDGYQDNDADGTCFPTCASNDCNGIGVCDDSGGLAVCDCEGLRGGDSCERCTAGYELEDDGSCTWVGSIVQNGKFVDDSAWEVKGSAAINLNGEYGRITEEAQCSGGSISQIVEMPDADAAEPMILQFKAWSGFDGSLGVRLGDSTFNGSSNWPYGPVNVATSPPSGVNNRICLGAGALGGKKRLAFAPGRPPDVCNFDHVQVDDVAIVRDETGLCPAVPGVRNRSFVSGSDEWELIQGDPTGTVTVSGGSAVFSSTQQYDQPEIRQAIRIPSSEQMPGAAFRLTLTSGDGGVSCDGPGCYDGLEVRLGLPSSDTNNFQRLGIVRSTGSSSAQTVCVPANWRGTGGVLSIRGSSATGSAGSNHTIDVTLESVDLTDVGACAIGDDNMIDGGFDSTEPISAAFTFVQSSTVYNVAGAAFKSENTSFAHEGDWFGYFYTSVTCESNELRVPIVIPPPTGSERAALVFHYQTVGTVDFNVCTGDAGNCEVLSEAASWQEKVVCLDPARVAPGMPMEVYFSGYEPYDGGCGINVSNSVLYLDAMSLGTHPDCN